MTDLNKVPRKVREAILSGSPMVSEFGRRGGKTTATRKRKQKRREADHDQRKTEQEELGHRIAMQRGYHD